MHKALSVLSLALVFAFAACGGGEDPAGNGGGEDPAKNGGGGGAGGVLSSGRIAEALLKELTEVEVDGFDRSSGMVGRGNAQMSYVSKTANAWGRKANVRVMVTSVPPGLPVAPDSESLKTDKRRYMSMLSPVHIENPDLVFETGTMTLASGRVVLHTYARSYSERKVNGGTTRSSAHSLHAWTFDGRCILDVNVDPGRGGARVKSAEDQKGEMNRDEMLAAAKPILEALAPKVFAAD